MTERRRDARAGGRFLRYAGALIGERLTQAVILPAVADFREELHDAAGCWNRRLAVRCRWYSALCCLLILAPLRVAPTYRAAGPGDAAGRTGGRLVFLLALTLFAGTWPFFGAFVSAALVAGSLLAILMRAWHTRHPSLLRDHARAVDAAAEINLSAIHVGGDVAGLMFAAGSTIVVLVGLPQLWWYFAGALFSSLLVVCVRLVRSRRDSVIGLGISTGPP